MPNMFPFNTVYIRFVTNVRLHVIITHWLYTVLLVFGTIYSDEPLNQPNYQLIIPQAIYDEEKSPN